MSGNSINAASSCGCFAKMNFCFWAKLIVAVPALPLIGYIASLAVDHPDMKMLVAAAAVIAAVGLAIKLDRIPALNKKIVKR